MKQLKLILAALGLSASLVAAQGQVKLVGFSSSAFKAVFEQHIKNMKVEGLNTEIVGGTMPEAKERLMRGEGDFAVLEVPFTNEELKSAPRAVVHVPFALSAIVMGYNLPNLNARVKLSRKAFADIFLGKITRWNDAKLAQDNPGVNLPDLPITLMLRTSSSPSNTVANLTDYLSRISSEWSQKVSRTWTFTPKWPAGNVTPSNILKLFQDTPGALSVFEVNTAIALKINFALLENASGKYVDATNRKAISEAAADRPFPADTRVLINDAGGNAYPLVAMAWIAFAKELKADNRSLEQSQRLLDFVEWLIHDGQLLNESVGFGRIPQLAVVRGDAILKSITYDDVAIR